MYITKLTITGASGYLSQRLLPLAASRASVVGVARNTNNIADTNNDSTGFPVIKQAADLTDYQQIRKLIDTYQPDAIIHAAAATRGADQSQMNRVNHLATRYLAELAGERGIRLVMVSTDMVHAGTNAPYDDDAQPTPINTYGESKAQAELAVASLCPAAAIVRTSLIYGLDHIDHGTRGFADRLENGEPLNLFTDVIRQPVWIETLANALCQLALVDRCVSGPINIVGSQALSRADFAIKMLRYWRSPVATGSDRLRLVSGANVAGIPMDLRLRCTRAKQLGWALPGVDEVLSQGLE
ncbi:MAG: sugar nucleotide-binding protein [Burkholderiaceae bacterium]